LEDFADQTQTPQKIRKSAKKHCVVLKKSLDNIIITKEDMNTFEKHAVSLNIVDKMSTSNGYFTGKETTIQNIVHELAVCTNSRIANALQGDDDSKIVAWLWTHFPVIMDNTGRAIVTEPCKILKC